MSDENWQKKAEAEYKLYSLKEYNKLVSDDQNYQNTNYLSAIEKKSIAIANRLLMQMQQSLSIDNVALYWASKKKEDPNIVIRRSNGDYKNGNLFADIEEKLILFGRYKTRMKKFYNHYAISENKLIKLVNVNFYNLPNPIYLYRFCTNTYDDGVLIFCNNASNQTNNQNGLTKRKIEKIKFFTDLLFNYFKYIRVSKPSEIVYNDLFQKWQKKILNEINEALKIDGEVTVSRFVFESYDHYLYNTGDHFIKEVISEIKNVFIKRLKKKDRLFVLSPREYLIISPACNNVTMESRFPERSFIIKGLVFKYKASFLCLENYVENAHDFWFELYHESAIVR